MEKFSDSTMQAVWEKGYIVPGYDKELYRKDECGAWMIRGEYGNRDSLYGWEIDHIKPVDSGGTDDISNLRPLQWENNATKSNGRLTCPVKAYGNKNIQ